MRSPNILFVLIDDLGWADLGCYGSSFYETPCLDRWASRGMRFTDAYAACPVCSPTRASILTGRYPAEVGVTNFIPGNAWGKLMGVPYFHELPKIESTIAQALSDHGYQTWHVGKWHLGPESHYPDRFGFDVNIGGKDWGMLMDGYFSPWGVETLPDGPPGQYMTDRLTDEAIGLMRRRDPDRPFFLNLWHYAVHTPLQAPADLIAKYERKARELGLDRCQAIVEGEYYPALHMKDSRIQRRVIQSNAAYAAMIENLDTNLGRTFDALEELGIADETLVIFTSDNGGMSSAGGSPTCNAPLSEGKGWMDDGGNRVCLIASWPGVIEPGLTCSEPVTSTDFYPTMVEAAGADAKPRQPVSGRSLMPLLRGQAMQRGPIFWHYPHYSYQGDTPACAIRHGDWKLIEYFEDGRITLFNLAEDIGESHDLSAEQPDRRDALHAELVAWRESVGAKIPEVNPDYQAMLAGRKPCPDGTGHIPGSDHDD